MIWPKLISTSHLVKYKIQILSLNVFIWVKHSCLSFVVAPRSNIVAITIACVCDIRLFFCDFRQVLISVSAFWSSSLQNTNQTSQIQTLSIMWGNESLRYSADHLLGSSAKYFTVFLLFSPSSADL